MLKLEKDLCCGCTACVSVCPQKCLEMITDAEGFLIPSIAENRKCIDCGLCNKVCPILNPVKEIAKTQSGYIVQNTDLDIRRESTSGGAFSAIAQSILKKDGAVYGAAFDENFVVRHQCIERKEDLWKLRNSKYVQSELGDVFLRVRQQLEEGREVCFSGTPCQIEGLRSFLRKEYQNLTLVDVVCHGIGSPLVWKKYIQMQNGHLPERIYFRWKHYGYKYSTISFFRGNKEIYFGGVESDPMLRAYFSNNCDRRICYDCPFKKRYRLSDITIWDCFQPGYFDKSFDDDIGTSSLLVHSAKGEMLFAEMVGNGFLRSISVDADALVKGNNEMVKSVRCGTERDAFLSDAQVMDGNRLFEKYFPEKATVNLKKAGRILLLKLGLYRCVKYILFLARMRKEKNRLSDEAIK